MTEEQNEAEAAAESGLGFMFELVPRYRALERITDMFVTVELTNLWRVHMIYGKKQGGELVTMYSQRFGTLTTMMTLLIGTQTGTFFAPGTSNIRDALATKDFSTPAFWAGIFLMLGLVTSVSSLITILHAWSLNSAISSNNAHSVYRSSLWLYVSSLPIRLALLSIYWFVVSLILLFFATADWVVATPFAVVFCLLVFYITSLYSAAGRVLMYAGAVGDDPIMEGDAVYELSASELTSKLLEKAVATKEADIPVRERYRIKCNEKVLEEGGSSLHHPSYGGNKGGNDTTKED